MSLTSLAGPSAAGSAKAQQSSFVLSTTGLVLMGMMFSIVITLPTIKSVLATGFYLDPDDAMRMSQARDWMNGQGWFDLMAYRLDPPNGVFMHWTRLVDVPVALIARFFELFADQETAERLMRLTLPMLLLAGLFALSARIGCLVAGPVGPLGAVILTMCGGSMFGYFQPGRLDHDHVSIFFLIAMTASLLRALDPACGRAAVVAGLVIAAGLAVSLETLPFAIVAIAILPMAWIIQGAPMRANMERFAWSLMLGLIAGFALVVAPSRYFVAACDTLSIAHMVGGLVGAALCVGLARATPLLPGVPHRLGAGMAAGLATIGAVALSYPACLGDPYAGLDPVLRDVWLARVSEARPLSLALHKRPTLFFVLVLPMLLGLAGAAWAVIAEKGLSRARWLALGALMLAGLAAGLWQVRALGEALPLTMFGTLFILARLVGPAFEAGKAWAGVLAIAVALPLTPFGYGLAMPDDTKPEEAASQALETACRQADAFTAIASLPRGVLLAPIDTGAHLLARTPHGVIAAPFHRDVHGNRLAIDAFTSPPEQAEAIVRGSGARYIVICPHINDIEMYREEAPAGLAAELDSGRVPDWLETLKIATPYHVFRVR